MSKYFLFNDNELDLIRFNTNGLDIISDESDIECDVDYEEDVDEWLLEEPPDIYSDDHPWDSRKYSYRHRPDIFMLNVNL